LKALGALPESRHAHSGKAPHELGLLSKDFSGHQEAVIMALWPGQLPGAAPKKASSSSLRAQASRLPSAISALIKPGPNSS